VIPPASAFVRFKLPSIAWFLMIMGLLSLPGRSLPTVSLWEFDKLVHVFLFGMQTLLFWLALELPEPMYRRPLQSVITAAILTALFGAASEVYQHLFTDRTADINDVLANIAGCSAVLLAVAAAGAERARAALRSRLLKKNA
jgi:VanZ family protein